MPTGADSRHPRRGPHGPGHEPGAGAVAGAAATAAAQSSWHATGHGHPHAGPQSPAHDDAHPVAERVLWIALLATGGFAIVEAIGAHIAGSLAPVSDAGHMATDAAAFVVALVAQVVARRPPSERASYGYGRAEVLAARFAIDHVTLQPSWPAPMAARGVIPVVAATARTRARERDCD